MITAGGHVLDQVETAGYSKRDDRRLALKCGTVIQFNASQGRRSRNTGGLTRWLTSGCTCQNAGHRLHPPHGRLHGVLQVNRGR